jgi:hypothetical protein
MEPRLAYIALNQIRGVGPRTAQKLLAYCTSPAHIFQLSMILLGLEMKHVITSLPGGVVELVHDVRYVNRGADE